MVWLISGIDAMKINEILKRYEQEWLLIEVNEFDESWEPIEGEVIFHSSVADEVGKEMLKLKGKNKNLAIRYAGEFPGDFAVLV